MEIASKEDRALVSAEHAFTRYGYARTTMGDIARGAGMSRPALYLVFPDKEAAFTRVIAAMDDRTHARLAAIVAGGEGLEDMLLSACLDWALHGVELAAAHPDAADLFDLRFAPVRQVYSRFIAFVAELISPAVARAGLPWGAAELARVLVYGLRGLRTAATDPADMRRMVEVQVRAFHRALEPGAAGGPN